MRKEVIQIRCSEDEKGRWNDAANSVGLELSPWIRLILDRATRPGAPPLFPLQPPLDNPDE